MNLLSDAAQSQTWEQVAPLITNNKTLYFSHGFSVVFKDLTHVIPPKDVDVILVAPKGSGRTVRTLFKEGRGINSSVAVFQDVTGKALEKAVAIGVGIGSGYMYETTFEKEVYSDLYGERGVLMGGIRKSTFIHSLFYNLLIYIYSCLNPLLLSEGMFLAQYKVLRKNGHSPSEAFNETVEEATQSLFPLIGQHGYLSNLNSSKPLNLLFKHLLNIIMSLSAQNGLHVQRLLDHRPSRCARLGTHLRKGQPPRLREAVRIREERHGDEELTRV